MTRLIDADALTLRSEMVLIRYGKGCLQERLAVRYEDIENAPTIDAVQVIRCKDCEDCTETKLYDGQRWNYCMRLRCVVKENDFCCWAERKYPKIKAKVTE
jgi:hypothetical protein